MRFFFLLLFLPFARTVVAETETLSLVSAVSLAVRNNPEYKTAALQARQAELRYCQSLADNWMPDIGLSGRFTLLDPDTVESGKISSYNFETTMTPPFFAMTPMEIQTVWPDNYSATLGVTKPLFLGFRLRNAQRIRKNEWDLARLKAKDKQEEVLLHVMSQFYGLFILRENLELLEEMNRFLKEQYEFTSANYRSGILSEYDLIRSRVQYDNNRPFLVKTGNALMTAERAFRNLIGLPGSSPLLLEGSLTDTTNFRITGDAETLLRKALERSLPLQEIAMGRKNLELSRKIVSAARLPALAGFFNYNYDYKKKDADRAWVSSWNTGLSLSLPLDDLLPVSKTAFSLRELDQSLAQMDLSLRQVRDMISLQVQSSLNSIRESRETINVQTENVLLARKGLEIVRTRYRAGNASALELSDAERSYNQAKLNHLQSYYDYFTGTTKMMKLIGELSLPVNGGSL